MSRKTRREFHKAAAALGAAAIVGGEAQAQQRPAADMQAKALAAIVQERYGKFLTEEQITRVRARLQAQVGNARQLDRVPLQNGDEPDFAFTPDVP